ncbi:MAG: hypothetical protein ABI321_06285 [Polyangia bacterium]
MRGTCQPGDPIIGLTHDLDVFPQVPGRVALFVTTGVGTILTVRFGVTPELALLTLR